MANNISLSEILHTRPAVVPTIYGYILPEVKSHEGYIKIGYTDRDVETRIKEQLHTAAVASAVASKRLFAAQRGGGQKRVVPLHAFGCVGGGRRVAHGDAVRGTAHLEFLNAQ